MQNTMYCVHEQCKHEARVLAKMEDIMNHSGSGHKVVDLAKLKEFVTEKFSEFQVTKIDSTIQREAKTKQEFKQIVAELKQKLDEYLESESKKLPSLSTLKNQIKAVEGGKGIDNEIVKNLLNFNLDSIPKYSNVLETAEKRLNEIKQAVQGLLKEGMNYNQEVVSLTVAKTKWLWDEQMKGATYRVSKDLKVVESPTNFMGWSFILVSPNASLKALHEIELGFEEMLNEKNKLQTYNFAIGMTHLKARVQKGYDQQDLSVTGHGFYLLRSDGWVCHNSDKDINWKKDLAFTPAIDSPIKLSWNPQDHLLTIEQGKQSFQLKIDKITVSDSLYFCVHLKQAKCRIND